MAAYKAVIDSMGIESGQKVGPTALPFVLEGANETYGNRWIREPESRSGKLLRRLVVITPEQAVDSAAAMDASLNCILVFTQEMKKGEGTRALISLQLRQTAEALPTSCPTLTTAEGLPSAEEGLSDVTVGRVNVTEGVRQGTLDLPYAIVVGEHLDETQTGGARLGHQIGAVIPLYSSTRDLGAMTGELCRDEATMGQWYGKYAQCSAEWGLVYLSLSARPRAPKSKALVKYDPDFAAQQILNSPTNVTPGGRTVTAHAAERMVTPPAGRSPTTMAEVDQFLDTATLVRKVTHHPLGDTLTLRNANAPRIKEVVVDAATGKRIITVITPKR
jgi:hypothetical protein